MGKDRLKNRIILVCVRVDFSLFFCTWINRNSTTGFNSAKSIDCSRKASDYHGWGCLLKSKEIAGAKKLYLCWFVFPISGLMRFPEGEIDQSLSKIFGVSRDATCFDSRFLQQA